MSITARRQSLYLLVYLFAIVGFASLIYSGVSSLLTEKLVPTVSAQTDPFLDRRIGQIEQRLYGIESRLNRLEQESRITTITPELPGSNNSEIYQLRSQIDTLRLRVGELECAAIKLDERTLPETARRARKSPATGEVSDLCRQNVNEQLNLSARP